MKQDYHRAPRSLYWREQTCSMGMKILIKTGWDSWGCSAWRGKGFRKTSRNLTPAQGRGWPVTNEIENFIHLSQKEKKKKNCWPWPVSRLLNLLDFPSFHKVDQGGHPARELKANLPGLTFIRHPANIIRWFVGQFWAIIEHHPD